MGQNEGEPTIGQLIANASRDLSSLVRSEIELAKSELKASAKAAGTGGGLFGSAAFLGLLAIILLSIAAAYGVSALGLHPALAFLVGDDQQDVRAFLHFVHLIPCSRRGFP